MPHIAGVWTALVTPFDAEGSVDEQGLRYHIEHQLTHGVDGIVALGTTGETPTLTEKEKNMVITIARELTDGKIPLMVGTGHYSTQETILNTHKAKDLGADIALIVTPYYNKPTQEGIVAHFQSVASAVDIPIVVYNIPSRCGTNISVSTLCHLAEIPNIVGLKEASGNLAHMTETIATVTMQHPKFRIMSGDDAFTLPTIALGGHGVVSVASNLIPGQMKHLVDAALQENYASARKQHNALLPLFQALFLETNPIPIKTALRQCGLPAGRCRLPLCDLRPDNASQLREVLERLDLKKKGP